MDKLINIHDSRYSILKEEFDKEYFQHIINFLENEKRQWCEIYPSWPDIFRAFELTCREDVCVVIVWQDPYHNPWQADGLCFSVPPWITPPPSLSNIIKEIKKEYPEKEIDMNNGDLSSRATQWVLLLNAILTVQAHKPLAHKSIGRELFTNQVISLISKQKKWVVFMLWWSFAQSKISLIDNQKHLILTTVHPSPLSANRGGWFWHDHFKRCNEYLKSNKYKQITW